MLFFNTENKDFRNDVGTITHFHNKRFILSTSHGVQQFYFDTKKIIDLNTVYNNYRIPVAGSMPLLVYAGNKIGVLDSISNKIILERTLDTTITGSQFSVVDPGGTIFLGGFE